MVKSPDTLPEWTASAGGIEVWKKWVEMKANGCLARAKAWAKKKQRPANQLPSRGQWRKAILEALHTSKGRGHYSRFPLSLATGNPTTWSWPSVDHLKGPKIAELVIETRLVNDMKTIMSDQEFRTLIGHLAAVLKVDVKEQDRWQCRRSFAVEEPPDAEPPLPA